MNPFELFSLSPAPLLDREKLKALYLEEAERLHPDRVQGGMEEKDAAGKSLAEWNGAYEILNSNRSRLAWLGQWLTGLEPAKTGRVSGPAADRMMRVAQVIQGVDELLDRRNAAQGMIEIALLGGEMMQGIETVNRAQAEIAAWHLELESELRRLQEDWEQGQRDPKRVERLCQYFSYAEKAGLQLEERFLKLAESMP